jgi:hypothetical protein
MKQCASTKSLCGRQAIIKDRAIPALIAKVVAARLLERAAIRRLEHEYDIRLTFADHLEEQQQEATNDTASN